MLSHKYQEARLLLVVRAGADGGPAAHLCEAVWPDVPVRQWVLTLPYRVRFLCAYDAAAWRAVRRILVRALSGFSRRRAGREGLPAAKAGGVVFEQRFDSGLRLNLHFHGLWADGVFACAPGGRRATFHAHDEATDADVERLVRQIGARVRRWLVQSGKVPAEPDAVPADDPGALEPGTGSGTPVGEEGAAAPASSIQPAATRAMAAQRRRMRDRAVLMRGSYQPCVAADRDGR